MKKIRTVLVGCGGITAAWLPTNTVQRQIDIVGLVDIKKANAEKVKQKYGLTNASTGTDLSAMLKALKPDAVFDLTVPSAHRSVVTTALKHGCNVLGEKPMSDNMKDARAMVAAAKKSGQLYAVTQNYRYNVRVRSLQRFIQSGRIGPLVSMDMSFYLGAHFGGFRDEMKHVLLADMSIHHFDLARCISGKDAKTVYCHEWNPASSWFKHGAAAKAVFEMADGVVLSYNGSWCAEGISTGWNCEWLIVGAKGMVTWDGADKFEARIISGQGGFTKKTRAVMVPQVGSGGSHDGVIKDFVKAVRSGKDPETICTDNIKSVAMVQSAIESAEKGKRIKV